MDAGPLFSLDDRVALVTGSGRGMGLGIARALARQGAKVAVNDYFAERAEQAAAALRAEGFTACAAPGAPSGCRMLDRWPTTSCAGGRCPPTSYARLAGNGASIARSSDCLGSDPLGACFITWHMHY